ncbi:hypothetical protein Dsin_000265 [Dipteronia sinensis]|uniref:Endonuclease/exonuclease/phosphatase domain-containing protein n=1 Tax=Dipteronia sinensis TaxID=43782 RepID=A0AAE0EHL3_9ROSI|nr:hypothetical protein Dsin_000265 [Dipteronia sinensis]
MTVWSSPNQQCLGSKLAERHETPMLECTGDGEPSSVIDDCDLLDLGFASPKMTWNNKMNSDANIQERIDRLLADCSWSDLFPNAKIHHIGFNSSDHRPLLLELDQCLVGTDRLAGKTFKFEPFWLKDEDCGWIVLETWNSMKPANSREFLKGKLDMCASRLDSLSKFKFESLQKTIANKQKEVEDLLIQTQIKGTMNIVREKEREFDGLLAKEEIY